MERKLKEMNCKNVKECACPKTTCQNHGKCCALSLAELENKKYASSIVKHFLFCPFILSKRNAIE
ncbi:MAG: hypothetical protein LBH91_09250 [Prevotellaceae bacterium]|nr:hypothetical protein [Prevotellaceae bacterium]